MDIGMMQQEIISLTLTLPPGYVAELPKPVTLALPAQGGRYVYAASSPVPGTVRLLSRLNLDKPVYTADEYQALRELYRQMLAKQAEALVIKKTGSWLLIARKFVIASAARQSHPNDTRASRSSIVLGRLPRCARNDRRPDTRL
ncbi:MAG: hypothetical protein WKG07_02705 [Hymenobacter sp.]